MGYDVEVVERARARLAQAKADRDQENARRLAQAYAQVPRLKQIDMQLRQSMAAAAKTVFISGADVRQAMDRVRRENLALQQERKMLVEAHFEPGYLDGEPVCPTCGGSGYVGANMCQCLRELCRQEQHRELTVLAAGDESFEKFRLDYYPDRTDPAQGVNIRAVMEKTFKTCRTYAVSFAPGAGNLLFSGDTGLGKTFMSACVARVVAAAGYSVAYEGTTAALAEFERQKFSRDAAEADAAGEKVKNYLECDLMILDDLGTEMATSFSTAALYQLINTRLAARRSTVISTNLDFESLRRRYGAQIASRLEGEYTCLPFRGRDIRLVKKEREA